jgi:hypothetical protein
VRRRRRVCGVRRSVKKQGWRREREKWVGKMKGHWRHVATCGKAGVDAVEGERKEDGAHGNGVVLEKQTSGWEPESNVAR